VGFGVEFGVLVKGAAATVLDVDVEDVAVRWDVAVGWS
jgi:hypothetical protein